MNLYSETKQSGFFIEVMQLAVVCMAKYYGHCSHSTCQKTTSRIKVGWNLFTAIRNFVAKSMKKTQ